MGRRKERLTMKLRLGQPVHSLDGPYGVLGDIVVDPKANTVTHLVIEPEHSHRLARLVPVWMVQSDGQTLTVQLDARHVRQLQAASFADYIAYTEPIDLGDAWDVGTEDMVATAFAEIDAGMWGGDSRVNVVYDRIPRGEVEIRNRSTVHSSDDHGVGHVSGIVTDDDHVVGVAVRTGIPGRRHDVFVTLSQIASVHNDRIVLLLTRAAIRALPKSDEFDDDNSSPIDLTKERVDAVVEKATAAGQHLIDRAKSALHSHG